MNLPYQVQRVTSLRNDEVVALRNLMNTAFDGNFTDSDWIHALGGTHIIVRADSRIVAHAAIVPRTIWIEEISFRAGYIEAVAVLPNLQGKGVGTIAMRAVDTELDQYDFGTLSTGKHHFYERLGWERWRGPSWVRTENGDVRSADEDEGIMIKRTSRTGSLSSTSRIICEARAGDDW